MKILKIHKLKISILILLFITSSTAFLSLIQKNREAYNKFLSQEAKNIEKLRFISKKEEFLEKEKKEYMPLEPFFTAWQKHLLENIDRSAIVSNWDKIASKLGLLTTHKEIIERKDYIYNQERAQIIQICMSVEGAASKILYWLGQIEETCPLFRIDLVKICVFENNCQLEIAATLPTFKS